MEIEGGVMRGQSRRTKGQKGWEKAGDWGV